MATDKEAGRRMATAGIASAILIPGSNPHLDTIFFANFHVTTILAISTERKPNMISKRDIMERSQNSFCVRVTQTLICVCACDSVCVRSQNYFVRSHKLSA